MTHMYTNSFPCAISYDDITLIPKYCDISRDDIDISSKGGHQWPVIPSPMITAGSKEILKWAEENNLIRIVHRYFNSADDQMQYAKDAKLDISRTHFAIGTLKRHKEWILDLIEAYDIKNFCIDVAHGNTKTTIDTVEYIKSVLGEDSNLIVGNVADYDGTAKLIEAGADAIRVGIASGQACSTWINTGFGMPMVSSIIQAKNAAIDLNSNVSIIADGGIRNAGDIAKALAVGADYVMLGRIFSATNLGTDSTEFYNKNLEYCTESECVYKPYFGMASTAARKTCKTQNVNASVEGESGFVKYLGKTNDVINSLMKNLKASLSYNGSLNIESFQKDVVIYRHTAAAFSEKLIHLDEKP